MKSNRAAAPALKSSGVSALKILINQIDDILIGKTPPPPPTKSRELVESGAFVIYRLTSPEGKCYVGLTTRTFSERYHQHLYSWIHGPWNGSKLYEAFERYPPYLWKRDVLYRTANIDAASFLEKVFIRHYRARSNGYNTSDGGLSVAAIKGIKQRQNAANDVKVKASQPPIRDDAAIYHASDIGRILTARQLKWYRKILLLRS